MLTSSDEGNTKAIHVDFVASTLEHDFPNLDKDKGLEQQTSEASIYSVHTDKEEDTNPMIAVADPVGSLLTEAIIECLYMAL